MLNKDTINKQIMTRRTFVIGAGKLGLLFLLAGRMFSMQFIKKDEYKTLSDKNRIKVIIIPPDRGQIFDVNENIIAKNNTCFHLFLDKNVNPRFSKEISLVTEILELDDVHIKEVQKRVRNAGRRIAAVIIDCLNWKQVAIIEERRSEFKSLFVDTGFNRFYRSGTATAHIVGHLGKVRKNTKNQSLKLVGENFRVGVNGIESYYEESLRGKFGNKRIEVNARGKYVRELGNMAPTPGKDLHLNIDIALQKKALSYLSSQGCSAIVMDCTNGDVLISASAPSYNPNEFYKLSNKYWNSLINNPYKPLIDKTIRSLYPPGSIFKIITVLAALESGVDPADKIICTGGPVIKGSKYFRCARSRGHGALNMIDAVKHSCNTYIYAIARQIGADKIMETAKKLGLGAPTGVDLPGELSGFIPSKSWKKERYGTKWRTGDTLNLSIGQGDLLSTPMQLVRLIAAIASNGKLFTPRIVKGEGPPEYTQIDISPEHLGILKTALYHTMNSKGGTGYANRINYKSMRMAGKTGTAQVQSKKHTHDNLSREDIAWKSRNHAIFSGYAPFDNPKYAISIYYDHGGGGSKSATPIAKKIMLDVLSKYANKL
ncbi:MAG: penicillin-binding protein 2 [Rickettsiales bacterium]|nr:MAG: penicillin-binding protein 2 [Rickettsiales bacterium]